MVRNLRSGLRKQDGFTLIELIVVVAILGILAAVLTPRVLDAVDNAKTNAAMSSAKQVQLAMERYIVENDAYPTGDIDDGDDLQAVLGAYANIDPELFASVDYNTGTETTPSGRTVPRYRLTLEFNDGDITLDVTPDSITE